MLDLTKKALLTGIGLASMSKEKVEDKAKDLVDELKMSEEEGKNFIRDILNESNEARENLECEVEDSVKKVLDKLNISTADDINDLKSKLDDLEKKLDESGKAKE